MKSLIVILLAVYAILCVDKVQAVGEVKEVKIDRHSHKDGCMEGIINYRIATLGRGPSQRDIDYFAAACDKIFLDHHSPAKALEDKKVNGSKRRYPHV